MVSSEGLRKSAALEVRRLGKTAVTVLIGFLPVHLLKVGDDAFVLVREHNLIQTYLAPGNVVGDDGLWLVSAM